MCKSSVFLPVLVNKEEYSLPTVLLNEISVTAALSIANESRCISAAADHAACNRRLRVSM